MSAYAPIRSPRLDGSVFSPALGYHVHVGMKDGKLARVGISKFAHQHADEPRPAGRAGDSADAHEGPVAPGARRLLDRIARHCAGELDTFRDVPLALDDASDLDRVVLTTLVREVPPGEVVTYGELARMVGRGPETARAVGGAMARNPIPIVVPCHRVLPAGGRVGAYSGEGGWATKMMLLRIEGARGVWQQKTL